MPVLQFSSIVPSCSYCGTLQGAQDKNFLVLCGQSLSLKTGWEMALKRDRAALIPLAPWSRAMSQILSYDSSGEIPAPVMCLRD